LFRRRAGCGCRFFEDKDARKPGAALGEVAYIGRELAARWLAIIVDVD
jgi:hypothetical protein